MKKIKERDIEHILTDHLMQNLHHNLAKKCLCFNMLFTGSLWQIEKIADFIILVM